MAGGNIDMQQMEKFDSEDPIELEDQIQRLTEALGYLKKGIKVLVELDPSEPRVMTVKKGILRVLVPYEDLLQEKKTILKRVRPSAAKPKSRRTGK